jgi:uncharacterized protein with PIN domain
LKTALRRLLAESCGSFATRCCAASADGCVRLVTTLSLPQVGLPTAHSPRAAEGDRVLLTKDRRLATTVEGTAPVVLVPGTGIDEAARALRIALDIDWQHAPFTRCIVDNRPLEAAPPHLATLVPERSRAAGGPLRVCPECGRLYWPGGHVRRMRQRIAAWQQEVAPPS